jgi:hypothetical protein
MCKAALICNHQRHWKLQFLIPIFWVLHVMSRCFAALRLEARGTKPESGSKLSCGLGSEGKHPSNSTDQRLPRGTYLFFLPLNIYIWSGSCVEFWVLSVLLAGPRLCVEQYLWWHYNYKVCNFLALFWGGFARVFMKCHQVEAIARFGMDVVNGCLKLPLLVWYSLMGGDVHQVVVLNTLIAALWLYIQKVSVHMILFRTAYLITSHESHHQFKNILCKYVRNTDM